MRSQLTAIAIILACFATRTALATGTNGNCKCQDANGQYNDITCQCCTTDNTGSQSLKCPGKNHQCTSTWSPDNILRSSFEACCKSHGVNGIYCWD